MKKSLLAMTALAAMLFAGCTSSDEITTLETIKQAENAPTPISFGTYMGRTGTRAGVEGQINSNDKLKGTADINTSTTVPGFGVFAYMKGTNGATDCFTGTTWNPAAPNFMYNQKVDWNITLTGAWGYAPLKYWPNDFANGDVDNSQGTGETSDAQGSVASGKISFFAYAPYVDATASTGAVTPNAYGIIGLTDNDDNTEPKVTYRFKHTGTYGTDAVYDIGTTNNTDLLWGTRTTASYNKADGGASVLTGYTDTEGNYYNTDLTKQNTTETIDFNFKHALAKLGGYENSASAIQVVADFDANDGTPKESPTGTTTPNVKPTETLITLNYITIQNVDDSGNKFAIGGVFNLATGKWESHDYDGSFTKTYNVGNAANNTDVWEPATPALSYTTGWQQSSSAFAGIDHTFRDVFSSATDALYFIPGGNAKLKVTVQYTVRTYDGNLASLGPGETTSTKVVQTIANVVDFASLKPNHYYKLIIHLGLTSVKFAAAVDSWDSAETENQVIWLPSNTVTP